MQSILAAVEAQADYFTLLAVPRSADPTQLRDAYFRLAKVVHPDGPAFAGNPALRSQATRAFQAITLANATLSDATRRAQYLHQMMQAAMIRSEQLQGAMANPQAANSPQRPQTGPVAAPTAVQTTGVRPPISGVHATTARTMDVVAPGSRTTIPQAPGAQPPAGTPRATGGGPTAPTAMAPGAIPANMLPNQNRAMVTNTGTTGQFARRTSPAQIMPDAVTTTGQFQRPVTQTQPIGSLTPGAQPTLTPRTPSGTPISSHNMQPRVASSSRGLEPPPNAEVARIYLHTGRQQLNRRDWAGAQEALDLALPLLEGKEAADCKVMLGWAIFNNNANTEIDQIERPKKMWNEVATQFAKTQFHAQAAYYLAVWHKLHGELRHVMGNLQTCLDLQPNHIEAAREKRLLEARRSNLGDLQELEGKGSRRRSSSTSVPTSRPTPAARPLPTSGKSSASGKSPVVGKKVGLQKEPSWLDRLFGSGDKKK